MREPLENVRAADLVVKQVEAEGGLRLRLAIELPVNGAAIFLKSGAAKFPSLGGLVAISRERDRRLRRPAATLQGRWNGAGGGVRFLNGASFSREA
jgi:hypothetical protein